MSAVASSPAAPPLAVPSPSGALLPPPRSCDTFVFVAGPGGPDVTIFGKNSDRPSHEEQPVVFVPRAQYEEGAKVKCTYIEIPQVKETYSVVLSKPAWLWGCEMGANEFGVCGGNEAIWTAMFPDLGDEDRLLGMDVLRLALERGRTAREAAQICTKLIEDHGQGGQCALEMKELRYENGFLFADGQEGFIVETCGVHGWAMERIAPGQFRNISNAASIEKDIFAIKEGLQEEFQKREFWDAADGAVDWKVALRGGKKNTDFMDHSQGRKKVGEEHLTALAGDLKEGRVASGDLKTLTERFMAALRDEGGGICMRELFSFASTGSQISLIPSQPEEAPSAQHLFTCAPDPKLAVYKRFCFPAAADAPADAAEPPSLELWRMHRRLAVAAAEREGEGTKIAPLLPESVRKQLADWEEEAVAAAGEKKPGSPADLQQACTREMEVLSKLEAAS